MPISWSPKNIQIAVHFLPLSLQSLYWLPHTNFIGCWNALNKKSLTARTFCYCLRIFFSVNTFLSLGFNAHFVAKCSNLIWPFAQLGSLNPPFSVSAWRNVLPLNAEGDMGDINNVLLIQRTRPAVFLANATALNRQRNCWSYGAHLNGDFWGSCEKSKNICMKLELFCNFSLWCLVQNVDRCLEKNVFLNPVSNWAFPASFLTNVSLKVLWGKKLDK